MPDAEHKLLKCKWAGDPVLPTCSPVPCGGCPMGVNPIKLKQGWSEVKAQLLALVQNSLHFSVTSQVLVTVQLRKT